jgi:hypothetical protein
MLLDAHRKLFVLASLLYISPVSSPITETQEPIRVETNQVLVPVMVVDKERYRFLWNEPHLLQAIKDGNIELEEGIVESVVIHDLTPIDFQVFDDGKQQALQSVMYEKSRYAYFRDDRGYHSELLGEGGGKWISAEWPQWRVPVPGLGTYVIAYALPESPDGSCHQIKIKVRYRDAFVFARSQYCNSKHHASDPLSGTMLGKQMESELTSGKVGKIGITPLAVAFHTDSDAARVHIAVDWPSESLKRDSTMNGILGIVFTKDGTPVTRFSDLSEFFSGAQNRELMGGDWDPSPATIMTRYERQFILPPGEYDLGIVLSDGKNFGRARIPLTVDSYDRKELAISAISLCKQIQGAPFHSPQHWPKTPGDGTAKLPGIYVPLVSNDMEFKPTGDPRFKKGKTLYTYFEIYEPLPMQQSPATVQFQMRIVDLKTGEAKSDSEPISAALYAKAGSPVIPIGRGIDISKLPKGSYRLDVQAMDSAGQSTPWRSANFTVD